MVNVSELNPAKKGVYAHGQLSECGEIAVGGFRRATSTPGRVRVVRGNGEENEGGYVHDCSPSGSLLPSTSSTVTAQKARTDTTASSMTQACQTAP